MASCARCTSAALICLSTAIAWAQEAKPQTGSAPIVEPGAPGHSSKRLSPAAALTPAHAPSEADVSFMQGMIMHHSQAVVMTAMMPSRTHNKDLRELGERISISQTDEIKYMKQWLTDRGEPVSLAHSQMGQMAGMKGMDHMNEMNMDSMPLMPGMLTPQQMKALTKATGPSFDYLFLTGMIQHHTGALVMVQDLFNTPGAGQDNVLFDFATDVDNTQRAEIRIMQGMLLKEKQ